MSVFLLEIRFPKVGGGVGLDGGGTH